MGGSYRQCSECGKRALSIATRCPGCGRELPAPEVPERGPDLGRFLSPGLVAGVLAVAAVMSAAELGLTSSPSDRPSSLAADSAAAPSEVGYAPGPDRLSTAGAAARPAENVSELLVARTWTHVRRSRSRRADLEAVLTPGDTVLADSLQRDWYRVALDGEVLGYVHRSTLTLPAARTERPEAREGPGT